ncbi:MAG TPA: hypothetical protein VFZ91_06330 [Allosphingosinicella sp.]
MSDARSDPAREAAQGPYLMILEQSAHMDWDWLMTFCGYYWQAYDGSGVNGILNNAVAFAQAGHPYTVCEMGFFREFLANNPGQLAAIRALPNFHVISGGITSPDCLVCSGEGFIRNYLVGQTWLSGIGMQAQPHCWIPDDFGQDPELPALLQALGFVSVAFSRLSGSQSSAKSPPDRWSEQLYRTGLDFNWTASDGSALLAHWLTNNGYPPGTSGYGIGVNLEDSRQGAAAIDDFCSKAYVPSGTPLSYAAAPARVMYIPIDDDFMQPIADAAQSISDWNSSTGAAANVFARLGTFDEFVTMVMQSPAELQTLAYNGTPYWTGYYASRPALKTLHYQAARALVGAEIFGVTALLLGTPLPPSFWDEVEAAWNDFVPSTHHDYVCGTAVDQVYLNEQLPRLTGIAATAAALQESALGALAALPGPGGNIGVGNPLGFARYGVAEIPGIGAPAGGSFEIAGWRFPVQASAEGGLLLFTPADSFGYATGTASQSPPDAAMTPAEVTQTGGSYCLQNGLLTAYVDAGTGTLLSLSDAQGNQVLKAVSPGDDLRFYLDKGGLYRFGNEAGDRQLSRDTRVRFSQSSPPAILETGPLRVRVSIPVDVTVDGTKYSYTREIALVVNEPFLRITITGAAPPYYSVMTGHTLLAAPATIDHGTAGHWTRVQPSDAFWDPPVFRATHNYLLPRGAAPDRQARGPILCAVFHGGMPAWAIDADGSLIGCLLRNTPTDDGLGASGHDYGTHTQTYALRVASGLSEPETGQPLREALGFNTPILATTIPSPQAGAPLASFSLASLPADSPAVLTVAKPGSYHPGSLILRVYQPTNAPGSSPFSVRVTLGGPAAGSAQLVNAAEGAGLETSSTVTVSGNGLDLTMTGALATIELPEYGPLAAAAGTRRQPRQDQPTCPNPGSNPKRARRRPGAGNVRLPR